jgi:hypothetical protein
MRHLKETKMESLKSEFFECECHSDEHVVKFTPDLEDDNTLNWRIYVSVYLNQYRTIWGRLKTAVKYLFGYKCKYGQWDTAILTPEDCSRLKLLIEKFEAARLTEVLKKVNSK